MAQNTKKKNAPARTKSAPARKSTKKPAARSSTKKTARSKKQPPKQNHQLHSVLLFGAGLLIACFAVIEGTRVWRAIHDVLLGIFGLSVMFVPFILIYTGYLIGQEQHRKASGRAVWGILLTVITATCVQVFIGDPLVSDGTTVLSGTADRISILYQNGKMLHGGGLISGLLAIPLVSAFDVTGAKIITVILLLILFMLLTNKSISECLHLAAKPFVWLWHLIVKAATSGYEGIADDFIDVDDYEEADEDDLPPDDDEDDTEDLIAQGTRFIRESRKKLVEMKDNIAEEQTQKREKRRQNREDAKHMQDVEFILENSSAAQQIPLKEIEVDVPLSASPAPNEKVNILKKSADTGITPASGSHKMSSEEEEQFRQIVEKAAKEDADSRTNRLPWDDPEEDAPAEPDDSVYEEEPEIPYTPPPIQLLQRADNSANDADKSAELREKGKQLVDTLASFGVSVRITGIRRGPTVTRYEIQPAAGVKISKITALADDIGLNLGGQSVRIEAPIPGKPAVGVEVPNNTKDTVSLREILESEEFTKSQSKLTFAVGKDIDGHVILGDIAKMPHMIIAGTTGSGKSVCTNSIIMSILFHASPNDVKLVLVDPKVVEFQPYDGIPHLLTDVVTNPQKAAGALNWAVNEMEKRYALCATYGVRDLSGYNKLADKNPEIKRLPQILIIIDEFADLMMAAGKEVETAVIRIAQKARAAGIHLVIATQRPTVDVITGLIKSNVPSRIGMSVKSAQDSRIILDCCGAETLLGNGDLLFYPNGWREPKRVQGCFTSDAEVEAVTTFLKERNQADYDPAIMEAIEQNMPVNKNEKASDDEIGELTGDDALVLKAAELAVDAGQLSTTALQRRLRLGYAKAARIVDEMEERGIIGPSEGSKPRKVLMTPQELTEWKLRIASSGNKVD